MLLYANVHLNPKPRNCSHVKGMMSEIVVYLKIELLKRAVWSLVFYAFMFFLQEFAVCFIQLEQEIVLP